MFEVHISQWTQQNNDYFTTVTKQNHKYDANIMLCCDTVCYSLINYQKLSRRWFCKKKCSTNQCIRSKMIRLLRVTKIQQTKVKIQNNMLISHTACLSHWCAHESLGGPAQYFQFFKRDLWPGNPGIRCTFAKNNGKQRFFKNIE